MSNNRKFCLKKLEKKVAVEKRNSESDQNNSSKISNSASNETDDSIHIPAKCTPLTDSQKQVKKNCTVDSSRVAGKIRISSVNSFIARSEYRELPVGIAQVLSNKNMNAFATGNRYSNFSPTSSDSFRSYNFRSKSFFRSFSNPSSESSLPSVFSPLPPQTVQVPQNKVQRHTSESSRSYHFSFSNPSSESDRSISSGIRYLSLQNVQAPPKEFERDSFESFRWYDFSSSNPSSESERSISSVVRSPSPPNVPVPSNDVERDAFESFDILSEVKKILESLSVDILNSLDAIPNSNALPLVVKKYSKTASTKSPKRVSSDTVGGSSSPLQEEYMDALAGFQIRCLEFRELIHQYAEAILSDCRRFSVESNYQLMSAFVDSVNRLKDNILNFKSTCEARLQSLQSRDLVYANVLAIFMQVTFLHTLEQQNDGYLTRLQSGVDLLRAHCKFVWYQNEANKRMNALLEEIHIARRTTTGCRV